SGRLAQARERLRQRLARRGFSLPAVLCAVALVNEPGRGAVPAALTQATVRCGASVVAGGAAPGNVVSPQVAGGGQGGTGGLAAAPVPDRDGAAPGSEYLRRRRPVGPGRLDGTATSPAAGD